MVEYDYSIEWRKSKHSVLYISFHILTDNAMMVQRESTGINNDYSIAGKRFRKRFE